MTGIPPPSWPPSRIAGPGDLGRGDLASLYAEVAVAAEARASGLPVVLTGHLHVSGGDVSIDSERRIVIGGEEAEASTLFDARAAYVALGHLHRPQNVAGSTLIRYAGSPIPLSVAERDYRHSVTVVDLADGAPRVAKASGEHETAKGVLAARERDRNWHARAATSTT